MNPIALQPAYRVILLKISMMGVLFAAAPVHGMVYMWRDSVGVSHYANKEYEIPARYKARITYLYPEATDTAPSRPAEPAKPDQPLPVAVVQPVKPYERAKEPSPAVVPPVVASPRATTSGPPVRRGHRPPRVHRADDE